MLDKNDPKFKEMVENGIPLMRLEKRLWPEFGLDDRDAEMKAHDGYHNFSQEGFLGKEESLLDVIYNDWKIVEEYGTTHKEIAEALAKALKKEKVPNRKYKFMNQGLTMGSQDCPWNCEEPYFKGSSINLIYNKETTGELDLMRPLVKMMKDTVDSMEKKHGADSDIMKHYPRDEVDYTDRIAVVSGVNPHLIEKHYFFEGKQAVFRADPRVLIPALKLGNYK